MFMHRHCSRIALLWAWWGWGIALLMGQGAPQLTAISTNRAQPGALITLTGLNFLNPPLTAVTFNFTPAQDRDTPARITYVVVDPEINSLNSAPSTITLQITAVNDAPTIALNATLASFIENGDKTTLASGLALTDVDSSTLSSATVRIVSGLEAGTDVLSISSLPTGLTSSWNASTGELTITGSASVSAYQSALRSLAYRSTSDNPSTATKTVSFTVRDSANLASQAGTMSVAVVAVNDAPTASTPASLAATEQTSLSLYNKGLDVADVDSGSGSVTVSLSVNSGVLSATSRPLL